MHSFDVFFVSTVTGLLAGAVATGGITHESVPSLMSVLYGTFNSIHYCQQCRWLTFQMMNGCFLLSKFF